MFMKNNNKFNLHNTFYIADGPDGGGIGGSVKMDLDTGALVAAAGDYDAAYNNYIEAVSDIEKKLFEIKNSEYWSDSSNAEWETKINAIKNDLDFVGNQADSTAKALKEIARAASDREKKIHGYVSSMLQ